MSVAAGQAYGTKWRKVGRECELIGQAAGRACIFAAALLVTKLTFRLSFLYNEVFRNSYTMFLKNPACRESRCDRLLALHFSELLCMLGRC